MGRLAFVVVHADMMTEVAHLSGRYAESPTGRQGLGWSQMAVLRLC
jgi:hypothetical protein